MKKNLIFAMMIAIGFTCFAANPASDFDYDMSPDGSGVMIKKYKGTSTKVDIPETIEGLPVVQIGDTDDIFGEKVFPHTMYTKSQNIPYTVTVPKSVKVVGTQAFASLKGKITIDTTKLTKIGRGAFSGSDLTGTVVITKGCKLGASAFEESKITAVVIQEGVESLGEESVVSGFVFASCSNLKSVTFPKTLKSIARGSFNKCANLTEVIIPEGLKIEYADDGNGFTFKFCSSLNLATKAKIKATGYTGEF
ncbi:leucine-rich repeat domain-containing protein [uncultured Treponema sp.]|uniref:leucine-rich repeat domain-containing protein n=1 Tax=uncultured Treponema sp. TaxID=162155 RepID=UPI00258761A4|nr:leucine-rich repeat domain-containing protein [uncultured Treponema sp.]